jgi:hypothetical protein
MAVVLAFAGSACGGDDSSDTAAVADTPVDPSTTASSVPTTSTSTTTTTTTAVPTTTEDPTRAAMRTWMFDTNPYQRFGALAEGLGKIAASTKAHDSAQIEIDCRAFADAGRDGQAMLPVPDPIVDQNLAVALDKAIEAGDLCERGAQERSNDLMIESSNVMAEFGTAITAAQAQLDTYK